MGNFHRFHKIKCTYNPRKRDSKKHPFKPVHIAPQQPMANHDRASHNHRYRHAAQHCPPSSMVDKTGNHASDNRCGGEPEQRQYAITLHIGPFVKHHKWKTRQHKTLGYAQAGAEQLQLRPQPEQEERPGELTVVSTHYYQRNLSRH